MKLNGPYEVGFREFRTAELDNEVSVFYPISKEEHRRHINDPGRNTKWLRHGDKTLAGLARAADRYSRKGKGGHVPLWSIRFFKNVVMNTLTNGELQEDFNSQPLIPIVCSHSHSANRTMHTGIYRDFASHGYIVFVLDHRDESCSYVESRDGKNGIYFNNYHVLHDMEFRRPQIQIRIKETKALIDELSKDSGKPLLSKIGFPSTYSLDLSKLSVAGHSYGGMTVLKVAHEDPRVKLCALLDPWLFIYHKEILSGEVSLSIPVTLISTELFIPYCEGFFPQWDTIKALFRHSTGKRHENIVLKGTDHKHQCDLACLLPFEMFVQSRQWP